MIKVVIVCDECKAMDCETPPDKDCGVIVGGALRLAVLHMAEMVLPRGWRVDGRRVRCDVCVDRESRRAAQP